MDPVAALNEIREIIARLQGELEDGPLEDVETALDRLVDLWNGLDDWMQKGGFSPWDLAKNPALAALKHHVSGAIARGEGEAITAEEEEQ